MGALFTLRALFTPRDYSARRLRQSTLNGWNLMKIQHFFEFLTVISKIYRPTIGYLSKVYNKLTRHLVWLAKQCYDPDLGLKTLPSLPLTSLSGVRGLTFTAR